MHVDKHIAQIDCEKTYLYANNLPHTGIYTYMKM